MANMAYEAKNGVQNPQSGLKPTSLKLNGPPLPYLPRSKILLRRLTLKS
jgi:hypothetical protein